VLAGAGLAAHSYATVLRNKRFLALLCGQATSRLGDAIYRLALAWGITELTGSAAVLGVVLFLSVVPPFVLSLLGGAVGDIASRRQVLLVADLAMAAMTLTVAFLVNVNTLAIVAMGSLAVAYGVADAFAQPALGALVPEVVEASQLTAANALSTMARQVASLAGPGAGAVVLATGGLRTAFAIDSASFMASAILLLFVPSTAPARSAGESVMRKIVAGIHFIVGQRWLWMMIVLLALQNGLNSGPWGAALPLLVKVGMRDGSSALAALYAVAALGALLVTLSIGGFGRKLHRRGIAMWSTVVLSGICLALMGLHPQFELAVVLALFRGMAVGFGTVVSLTMVQQLVPREFLGRVISVAGLATGTTLPIGFAFAGLLADRLGPQGAFAAFGVALIAVGIMGLALRPTRQVG